MGPDATLAQFDRIFRQGKKNNFTMLGSGEVSKFDYLYGHGAEQNPLDMAKKDGSESDFEYEEEVMEDLHTKLGIEPEDIHSSTK